MAGPADEAPDPAPDGDPDTPTPAPSRLTGTEGATPPDEELDEAMDEIAPHGATQISIDALAKEVFKTVSIPPLSELVLEPKQRRLPPGGESMYTRW